MAIPMQVTKYVNKFDVFLRNRWIRDLEELHIPEIQRRIMEAYDSELVGVVTDRESKTNPVEYRDDFEEALDNFQYIIENENSLTLRVPDEDNFPWLQGRLRIIKNILDGTIGIFVEADEEQYIKMYQKRPFSEEPYDNSVSRKERVYLLKNTADVRRRQIEAFGKVNYLVRYPFSNKPPIDIFSPANNYVEENIKNWVKETTKRALKEFTP